MRNLATTNAAEQRVLADGYDLERQLRTAERRYAEARSAADQARDEWRRLSAHPGAKAESIQGARARFEAVAARCNRLRNIIDELEERLES
jgi:chromosome segregation ATPase